MIYKSFLYTRIILELVSSESVLSKLLSFLPKIWTRPPLQISNLTGWCNSLILEVHLQNTFSNKYVQYNSVSSDYKICSIEQNSKVQEDIKKKGIFRLKISSIPNSTCSLLVRFKNNYIRKQHRARQVAQHIIRFFCLFSLATKTFKVRNVGVLTKSFGSRT